MIRIAVCDDIKAERACMQNELQRYLAERDLTDKFECELFSDPQALIRRCTSNTYDLFLLDVLMPHMTGIETAKELQEMMPDAQFIFVTTTSEFIMDAFSVKALYYLLKPYSSADFDEAMDKARNFFMGEEQVSITLRTENDGVCKVNLSEIQYVAPGTSRKSIKLILGDRTVALPSYTMDEMKKILNDSSFTEGDGMLFNIENIRHMNEGNILMRNGEKISLSRGTFQKVRTAFVDYYEQ